MASAAADSAASRRGGPQSRAWRHLFRQQFHKTKICRFYPSGGCQKGEDCPYAHSEDEIGRAPDLTKTALCIEFEHGRCSKSSDACPFAHGQVELRTTEAFSTSDLRSKRLGSKDGERFDDSSDSDEQPPPQQQDQLHQARKQSQRQAAQQPPSQSVPLGQSAPRQLKLSTALFLDSTPILLPDQPRMQPHVQPPYQQLNQQPSLEQLLMNVSSMSQQGHRMAPPQPPPDLHPWSDIVLFPDPVRRSPPVQMQTPLLGQWQQAPKLPMASPMLPVAPRQIAQPQTADTQVLLFDDRPLRPQVAPPVSAKPPSAMPPGVFTAPVRAAALVSERVLVLHAPPATKANTQMPPGSNGIPAPPHLKERPHLPRPTRRSTPQDVQGSPLVSVPENDAGHFFIGTPRGEQAVILLADGDPGNEHRDEVSFKSTMPPTPAKKEESLSARRGLSLIEVSPNASTATPGSKASRASYCDFDIQQDERSPKTPVTRPLANDKPAFVLVQGQPIGSSRCSSPRRGGDMGSPLPDGFALSPPHYFTRTPTSSYVPSTAQSPTVPLRIDWPATPSPMRSPSPRRKVVTAAPLDALQLQLHGRLMDVFCTQEPSGTSYGMIPKGTMQSLALAPAPDASFGLCQVPSLRFAQ